MNIAICCDFDGTITLTDTGKEMLTSLTTKDWQYYDKLVINGEIGTRAALIKQWGMIEHTTMDEIYEIVDRIKIDPTFLDFYNWVKENGIFFIILSDGFHTYITRILENHGIDSKKQEIKANDMELIDNKIHLKFLTDNCEHDCANCKYSQVLRIKEEHDKVVYIGDGLSDILPSEKLANHIIAKRNEDLAKKLHKDPRLVEFSNFKDIQNFLEKILDG